MAALTLVITGMHCDNCKAKVAKALSHVDGVYAVEVDLGAGTARVDADKLDADRLIQAVQAVGYEAKVGS